MSKLEETLGSTFIGKVSCKCKTYCKSCGNTNTSYFSGYVDKKETVEKCMVCLFKEFNKELIESQVETPAELKKIENEGFWNWVEVTS